MSLELWWLGRAAFLSGLLALGALSVALFGSAASPGRAALRNYVAFLDRRLALIRWTVRARTLLIAQLLATAALLSIAATLPFWPLLAAVPLTVLLAGWVVDFASVRRITKLDSQIEGWVMVLANALKGSASLGEAVASSVALIPQPLQFEVAIVVKENQLGTPLDAALEHMSARVGTNTIASTVLSLRVARRSGGDLPKMLETAALALRELARLEGVVRSKTAEGRAQAWVIGAIPFPLVLLLAWMRPGFFNPLLHSFTGNLLLGLAISFWISAVVAARIILRVDI